MRPLVSLEMSSKIPWQFMLYCSWKEKVSARGSMRNMSLSKLKLVRLQRGLRQWDVAQQVGVTESQLSKIETGRIPLSPGLAEKIAYILGVVPEDIEGIISVAS